MQAQYESLKTKYRVSLSQSLILQCIQILSPNLIFVYTMNFQGSARLSQLKLFLIDFKTKLNLLPFSVLLILIRQWSR